ncbi:uncharacterized protein LOC119691177 isoform X2 [Plutella xylostella]|uniref:uncharacterized protein LOC119691177 isoform X2 n=1 Tax=Plutella xylostella TaxID=51655 RepID=UPI0020326A5C|nr:uncharacterized protein LOC119691177 isoform X2 [Plutella xylostella]
MMTSETEALKTSEFLRRRKLRLQQNVDHNNAEALLECHQRQEKLIRQLELLYAEGVTHVGAGHSQASQVTLSDAPVKVDLSKLRAKEAAEKLRLRKQRILDEKKKLLDRKLQARETANEISREKTKSLPPKPSDNVKDNIPLSQAANSVPASSTENKPKDSGDNQIPGGGDAPVVATKSDMATQWTYDPLPSEWDPAVLTLDLPEDNTGANEPPAADLQQPTGNRKKLDLFACSDEMPTSLRPVTPSAPPPIDPAEKTSLTLVSEYLQHRDLNLRGQNTNRPSRKSDDDLQIIRQTILRTRASKSSGNSVCHVHDEQLIPVPSWHAEFCAFCTENHTPSVPNSKSVVNRSVHSVKKVDQEYTPKPVLTGSSPFRRTRAPWLQGRNAGKANKSPTIHIPDISNLNRVPPVTVYDHTTRDTQHIPTKPLVSRDSAPDDDADAYSQAMKESSTAEVTKTPIVNKAQERRSKIAMTKQNVEKEYQQTMTFLNSLDKERPPKSTKIAFMDDRRQQKMNENHQRKMQHEFQKIEQECRQDGLVSSGRTSRAKTRAKSNSNIEHEDFEERDLEYTWMPVPEGDAALAVHALPTSPRAPRDPRDPRAKGVQFSRVDSYHEYRSRHKHTPPTKDTSNKPTPNITNVTIEDDDSDCTEISFNSSVEDKSVSEKRSTDAEGIIIYKIIDSKGKGKSKAMKINKDVAEMLSSCKKKCKPKPRQKSQGSAAMSMQQISEGVYRTVSEKGLYCNIRRSYTTKIELWHAHAHSKSLWENVASCMSHTEATADRNNQAPLGVPEQMQWKLATDAPMKPSEALQERKSCGCVNVEESEVATRELAGAPSLASVASYETATPSTPRPDTVPQKPAFMKPKPNDVQEASNFYIGASGLLHNEDYEVIIQLRKKGIGKESKNVKDVGATEQINKKEQEEKQADVKIDGKNKSIDASKNTGLPTSNNEDIKGNLHDMLNLQSETAKLLDETDKASKSAGTTETVQSKSVSCLIDSNEKAHSPVASHGAMEVALKPSISTQTSFMESISPAPRPVFLHMTSSTSTTYMSPPDKVLPEYLKDRKLRDHKKHSEKKSRKCKHSKIENVDPIDFSGDWLKQEGKPEKHCTHRHMATPPNTRRSGSVDSASEKCNEQTKKENKKTKIVGKPKTQVVTRCSVNKNQSIIQNKKKVVKSKLNPVIRNYVNKLLTLSKEGLKAIEVVNQDCSSVATPSSSIINIACNMDRKHPPESTKISLEQVKEILANNIVNDMQNKATKNRIAKYVVNKKKQTVKLKSNRKTRTHRPNSPFSNVPKLNLRNQNPAKTEPKPREPQVSNTQERDSRSSSESKHKQSSSTRKTSTNTAESAPTVPKSTPMSNYTSTDETTSTTNSKAKSIALKGKSSHRAPNDSKYVSGPNSTDTSSSTNTHHQGSDNTNYRRRDSSKRSTSRDLMNTSIQTGNSIDSDINFIKMTETKLQNIEKIANLTEVCTRRLSNLAKVLEKVRENKSNVYSHITTSSSSSDEHISHKNVVLKSTSASEITDNGIAETEKSIHEKSAPSPRTKADEEDNKRYVALLQGIPKPTAPSTTDDQLETDKYNYDIKYRGKPPTALSRIHLKHGQEDIIPHELSTVIEVDSPLSSKVRSKNLLYDNKSNTPSLHSSNESINKIHTKASDNIPSTTSTTHSVNPDLLQTNKKLLKDYNKNTPNNTAAKVEMMDLKKFNEIMLKPFVSIEEFAKQCNIGVFDDASNMDDIAKDTVVNDDLSSLHSEGSLPDVIGELLKRNLISKPFEYESVSNLNSTTISTESSFSALTLSKIKREKKKGSVMFSNKENISETSDSLSMSSNPDLENAFKKLGMGWASSTLRKTKERLALSSSSNTSSLGNSHQFKPLNVDKQNLSSSNLNVTKKPHDRSKSVQQQTSQLNSMTVKEFLDKELADKITFSKSYRNETEPEFMSLYETKLPDELKNASNIVREERSIDSLSNANRARTSTPVQLYKSAAYHSSSSSNNNTNGLFGNGDDLSSVKVTSGSARNHSTSDKDDLTIPNYSLRIRREASDKSKSD